MNRLLITASLWLWALAVVSQAALGDGSGRPNIVLVLVDDQETVMNTIDHMPNVQEHLVDKGTSFERHYCTVAVCCPSRVNLWTGQMAHNTNVTALNPPYGGFPKFIEEGYNKKHLALYMQESGYNTYYVGKLFNSHSIHNYNDPPMSGYTGSEFFLEPYTYQYFNVGSTRNGHEPHYPDGYSTDLVSKMGMGFLDEALEEPKNPFFLTLAPIAPHVYWSGRTRMGGPPHPAPRHRDMFKDEKVLRAKNFNPDSPSGVSWVYDLLKLDDAEVEKLDKHHVKRLQSLQAVDDMVGDMIDRLNEAGVLDNTYFIYTSDNGFHLGHHRLKAGKELGFETDINVPFVIRGPGIPEGDKRYSPTTHTDIAPTIMKLAGNDINDKEFDGLPMDLWEDSGSGRVEHVAVEFWAAKFKDEPRNTYKGLRIEAEKYGFYYAVWCTNEKELYDMKNDYDQIDNLMADGSKREDTFIFEKSISNVADRLDALMMVTKTCKQSSCTDPWKTLHSDGNVRSLEDALDSKFDDFYRNQVKVSFSQCLKGQLREYEGAQVEEVKAFGDESVAPKLRAIPVNFYWQWW